jgi:flagellar hook protein FlgE
VLTVTRGANTEFLAGKYPATAGVTGDIGGVTFAGSPDLNGKIMLKVTKNGSNYDCVLSGTHKDGTAYTETKTVAAIPGSVTFNDASLGTGASVTVNLHDTTADANNLKVDTSLAEQSFTLGTAIATQMTVTGYANQKSGQQAIFNSVTWDKSMTTFTMGDITFSVDPAAFGSLQDNAVKDMAVGVVGPGTSIPEKIGQMAIVTFPNTDGLSQEGENYYVSTLNSGEPKAYVPGRSGTGTYRAGSLEMSNVDLSREFTEMIITERGFQANTRMVTVSDEMLQELINMKR